LVIGVRQPIKVQGRKTRRAQDDALLPSARAGFEPRPKAGLALWPIRTGRSGANKCIRTLWRRGLRPFALTPGLLLLPMSSSRSPERDLIDEVISRTP